MTSSGDFRPLHSNERAILDCLLTVQFQGREALVRQLETALARSWPDNSGSIDLRVPQGCEPAQVKDRVPVEGIGKDADGMNIEVLLHVVDGFAVELEVFRADNGPMLSPLEPEAIHLEPY